MQWSGKGNRKILVNLGQGIISKNGQIKGSESAIAV